MIDFGLKVLLKAIYVLSTRFFYAFIYHKCIRAALCKSDLSLGKYRRIQRIYLIKTLFPTALADFTLYAKLCIF